MPRTASLLALTTSTVIGGCSSTSTSITSRLLIGDVFAKSAEDDVLIRGSLPSRSLNEQNESILKAMLNKETFSLSRDECLNDVDNNGTSVYGQCDILLFPFCTDDTPNICFNRINRQDAFYPDKHPKYYIDYSRIRCYPNTQTNNVDFACSSCSPGRWCVPEGRCILDDNLYGCWAVEDAAKDEAEDNDTVINKIDTAIIEDKTIALIDEGNAAAAAMMEMTHVSEEKGNDDLLPSDYPTYSPIYTDYPTYSPIYTDYPTYMPTES